MSDHSVLLEYKGDKNVWKPYEKSVQDVLVPAYVAFSENTSESPPPIQIDVDGWQYLISLGTADEDGVVGQQLNVKTKTVRPVRVVAR